MSHGHIGSRDIFVDKQEHRTVSLGFCCLILEKIWPWRQLHNFKSYYCMRNSDYVRIEYVLLLYRLHYAHLLFFVISDIKIAVKEKQEFTSYQNFLLI